MKTTPCFGVLSALVTILLCFFLNINSAHAQAPTRVIIDNGYLSVQGWGGAVHPSGSYFIRADRNIIHAYDRRGNILFQSFRAPCISSNIEFSADGKYMIVSTTGEMGGDDCERVIVFDFYSGELLLEGKGRAITNMKNDSLFYYLEPTDPELYGSDYVLHKYTFAASPIPHENDPVGNDITDSVYLDFKSMMIHGNYWFHFVGENKLAIIDLNNFELVKIVENVWQFSKNYLSNTNQLLIYDRSRDSLVIIDIKDLTEKRKRLPLQSNYFVAENDSMIFFVNIFQKTNYYCNINQLGECTRWYFNLSAEEYELKDHNDQFFGFVNNSAMAVIHRNTFLIDVKNKISQSYRTLRDTNLIHPAVVYSFPNDSNRLVINGVQWNITSAKQFTQYNSPVRNVTVPDTLEYMFEDSLGKIVNIDNRTFFSYLNQYEQFNFKGISYPADSWSDDEDRNMLNMQYDYYFQQHKTLTIYLNGDSVNIHKRFDYNFLRSKILPVFSQKKEKAAIRYIQKHYNAEAIYGLNSTLPDYIRPYRYSSEEKFSLKSVDYSSKHHIYWLYHPISFGKTKLSSTINSEEARKNYFGSFLKVSYSGATYLPNDEHFIISIFTKDELPDISLAGIYQENDLYFYDLCFPISAGRYITLNYAHGIFKLLNKDKQVIVQSSLYKNNEFIHTTPDGYYFASKNKLDKISIRKGDKVFPIEQFDLKLNRPDIVLERIGCRDSIIIKAFQKAYFKRLNKMGFKIEMLKDDFNLPELEIENLTEILPQTKEETIELELSLRDSLHQLDRINVWVNDVAVYGSAGISLRHKNVKNYSTIVPVNLARGPNKIQVSVLNSAGAESYKELINVQCEKYPELPSRYIIAIGVSKYADSQYNLTYAAKDASDMINAFQENDNYRKTYIKMLLDTAVTKENFTMLSDFLKDAQIDDEVILFFAGHGVLDDDFNYFLSTHYMNFEVPSEKGIAYEELELLLDGIAPLKKMILIDACHSGELDKEDLVSGDFATDSDTVKFRNVGRGIALTEMEVPQLGVNNLFELTRQLFNDLRKGTGATVISASGGLEFAMESEVWNNGLFTYALLQGLASMEADKNKDEVIMLSELQEYIAERVTTLSKGKQKPTLRRENASMDYRVW